MAETAEKLAAKIESGEPLSDADVAALEAERDIVRLGMFATAVRSRLHGPEVTFVRVADGDLDDTGRVALFQPGTAANAGELRVFGTPASLDAAISVVASAREAAEETPVSAFCLFELGKLPEGLPVVLAALRQAGLEYVAQAPVDRLANPEHALEALTDAGLRLARLTVDRTPQGEWTAVCRRVARLQSSLRSVRAFAPLARTIDTSVPTTGYDDVRRVALARILAGNVETIQVDWALYGPKLAQVALAFGADDIDSVPASDEGARGPRRTPVEDIRRNIRAAGYQPQERDGRFQRRG